MSTIQIADAHRVARVKVSDRAGRSVAKQWRGSSVVDLDASWAVVAASIVATVSNAQVEAARQAEPYVTAALGSQGFSSAGPSIDPYAFAGATREGLEIGATLYGAVTATKRLIGSGVGVGSAFASGVSMMQVLAATIVQDAGRGADKVASVARGGTMMARLVQPGACSRCAILAGVGHFTRHFERHPGCLCQTVPVGTTRDLNALPDGLFSSPEEYFDSLPKAEQDRVFTKSGAEAIRAGANPIQVVNARRGMIRGPSGRLRQVQVGMRPDGSAVMGYATVEGTTRRGLYGRRAGDFESRKGSTYQRTRTQRLMPETIMQWSKGDPNRAVQMLKRYGYIL